MLAQRALGLEFRNALLDRLIALTVFLRQMASEYVRSKAIKMNCACLLKVSRFEIPRARRSLGLLGRLRQEIEWRRHVRSTWLRGRSFPDPARRFDHLAARRGGKGNSGLTPKATRQDFWGFWG